MNLLNETVKALAEHNKTLKDVLAIQGNSFGMSIEDFIDLSDTEYDSGFGGALVADDLVIIGDNWWLERAEYDGSEWWEYKEKPKILPIRDDLYALTILQSHDKKLLYWQSLASINGIEEKK